MLCRGNFTEGSNPSLSAIFLLFFQISVPRSHTPAWPDYRLLFTINVSVISFMWRPMKWNWQNWIITCVPQRSAWFDAKCPLNWHCMKGFFIKKSHVCKFKSRCNPGNAMQETARSRNHKKRSVIPIWVEALTLSIRQQSGYREFVRGEDTVIAVTIMKEGIPSKLWINFSNKV